MKSPKHIQFESFLDKLKTSDNSTLIESVKQGYNTIFESDNVINVRGIANLISLFENPDIPLETKVETFLAVLAKTHGYYWAGLGEANTIIKRIPANISTQLIDAVDETGELHPDRIKYFRNQIPSNVTESVLPKLYRGIIPANKLTLLVSDEEYNSLNESVEEYKGEHEAPDADNGMPIYDLTGIYPADIYSSIGAKHYGDNGGDSMDNESISVIKSVRNRPRAKVKIYRAVPDVNKEVNDKIKSLRNILSYFNEYGFFPMNNEVVKNYTEKYYIDGGGYSLSYDEMNSTVIDEINNDIETLRSELQSTIKINSGDWVTTSRQYAVEHGQGNLNNKYKILSKTVSASTLFTDGNSIHEWGYNE